MNAERCRTPGCAHARARRRPYPCYARHVGLASAPAPAKRHSLVFDTDPIVPPADMTGKDPSMGVLNLDSNRKPEEDVPKENPEKDAKKVADETPAGGDVPKNVDPAASAAPVSEASAV